VLSSTRPRPIKMGSAFSLEQSRRIYLPLRMLRPVEGAYLDTMQGLTTVAFVRIHHSALMACGMVHVRCRQQAPGGRRQRLDCRE
jgi:hypothetical protein